MGEREGDLLHGGRTGLAHVVAGDRDRIPLRHPLGAERDDVGRQAQRRCRGIDVGAARGVLLEDVVLDGAAEALPGDALLLGEHEVEGEQDRRGGVDRHRRRDAVERDLREQAPHVGDRVDRHADPSDLASRHRVIAVVADLGRQVEGDRESARSLSEQVAVALIRFVGVREAGVLAHRPQAALVHLAIDAAREREVRRVRRPRLRDRSSRRRRANKRWRTGCPEGCAVLAGAAWHGFLFGVAHGDDCNAAERRLPGCGAGFPEASWGTMARGRRQGTTISCGKPLTELCALPHTLDLGIAQAFGQVGQAAGRAVRRRFRSECRRVGLAGMLAQAARRTGCNGGSMATESKMNPEIPSDLSRPPGLPGGVSEPEAAVAPGAGRAGLVFERYFSSPGRRSVRSRGVGVARRPDRQREGREGVRTEGRRGPQVLVADRHQRRGFEVFPRRARHAAARDVGSPADRPGRRLDGRLGQGGWLLRLRGERRDLPCRARAHPAQPVCLLQLAGLVQRRNRGPAAVLGLLHQLGRGHHAVDPRPCQDRGHALQVRLGHRLEPLFAALVARESRRRRNRFGPGLVHEGLRRLRRRDQERRQDPPRGEDGHPERRASGHPGLHPLQGDRGAQGLDADRRRLSGRLQRLRRRLRLDRLPERQPLGACHRRVHEGGHRGPRLDYPRGARTAGRWIPIRPAS